MKYAGRNIILLLMVFLFYKILYAEETNYLYKAVIKIPVADVYERPDTNIVLNTQALFNEEIKVIMETGYFVFAQVPDGYKGYIKISDITNDTSSLYASGDKLIVKSVFSNIYDISGNEIFKVPMTCIFRGKLNENMYLIVLPEGRTGFINKNDVLVIHGDKNIPLGSRENFAMTASLFQNTKYLWGGCSWNGIDCSGLTYIAAKMNGVKIPRDSLPQSQAGVYIDLRNAEAGDQLFFSSDTRKEKVTHTGIYLGSGNFIHSTTGGVSIINIYTSNYYMERFIFAKRLAFR
jgi:hypothetical protein